MFVFKMQTIEQLTEIIYICYKPQIMILLKISVNTPKLSLFLL